MQSRILFLGTGGSHAVAAKQYRATAGIIIQSGEHQFHLDPGPGAIVKAVDYGVNSRETTAVFVTHSHLTHCNDVNLLIEGMTHSGLDKRGLLVCNKTLFEGESGYSPYITEFHKRCVERSIIIHADQKLGIDNIEIHALPAKHSDPHALGFKFFTPNFILTYTGDTGFDKKIVETYKNSDILILNILNPSDVEDPNNLNVDDAVRIINRVSPRLAVITHFGIKALKADPIMMARHIQRETEVQTIAAKDGLAINPKSYAASMKQKTLNLYKV